MNKTQIPLEAVWQMRDTGFSPVCVVDFRVYLHSLLGFVQQFGEMRGLRQSALDYEQKIADEPEFTRWLHACWAQKLNRGPDMLPKASYKLIVVDDAKMLLPHSENANEPAMGYWRAMVRRDYKGNRASERSVIYSTVRDAGYEQCRKQGLHIFNKSGFEADDWAGAIYRLKLNAYESAPESCLARRELYYSTVDGDWMQLVDDASRQYWANTGPWQSRLKNEAESRRYVLKKLGVAIKHPREIGYAKHIAGDMGDNLPAGSDISLFDLTKASPAWHLEGTGEWHGLELALANSEPDTNAEYLSNSVRWCVSNCLPVVIGR